MAIKITFKSVLFVEPKFMVRAGWNNLEKFGSSFGRNMLVLMKK